MSFAWMRVGSIASIGLIVALAGCGAKMDGSLSPMVSDSASAVHPDNWFHTWKFYVKNELNVPVRQFARDSHCMQHLPKERWYDAGSHVPELVETSHDPKCYLKESSVTFDYFAKIGGGYGTVKWTKPFFFNYRLETISTHGLCFKIHNHDYRHLVINRC